MNTTDFLPSNYEVPNPKSNYMKLKEGINRFRILSSTIMGWMYWNEDAKGGKFPVRKRMTETLRNEDIEDIESLRHFWAFVVWNYEESKVQILELTQKGLHRAIRALIKDEEWGNPIDKYDIAIIRTGKELATRYELQPKPAKPTDIAITEQFQKLHINLEVLFTNEDPFSGNQQGIEMPAGATEMPLNEARHVKTMSESSQSEKRVLQYNEAIEKTLEMKTPGVILAKFNFLTSKIEKDAYLDEASRQMLIALVNDQLTNISKPQKTQEEINIDEIFS